MKSASIAVALLLSASSAWLGAKVRMAKVPLSGANNAPFAWTRPVTVHNSGAGALSGFQTQVSTDVYATTFDTSDSSLKALWHFSEGGSSATTADASGTGNIATLAIGAAGTQANAATAWANGAAGRMGQGLSFDGTDDYLTAASSGFPSGSSARTVEMWINPSSLTKDYQELFFYGTQAASQGFLLSTGAVADGTGRNKLLLGKYGVNAAASTGTLTEGVWQHVAVTVSSAGAVAYYINGLAAGTSTLAGMSTVLSAAWIARGWNNSYFTGRIDEVRVYDRVLSTQEIADHARLVYGLNAGLVGSWHFNEGSGTVVQDTSGNNNHGTLTSGAWGTGAFGGAATFNGTSSYVTVPDATSLNPSGRLTVSAWIYPTSTSSARTILIKGCGNVSPYDNYYFSILGTGALYAGLGYTGSTPNTLTSAAGIVQANQWQHVAMALQDGAGGFIKVYLNGTLVGTTNLTANVYDPPTSRVLYIGARAWSRTSPPDGGYWLGSIDEVRVYSRTLAAAEIAELASQTPKIRPDLQDLRFSSGVHGAGELPYWLESDKAAWVKAADLPAGLSTINMFYGNPLAAFSSRAECLAGTASGAGFAHCGQNTFEFFDDFEGGNMSAWSAAGTWTASSATVGVQGTYSGYATGAQSGLIKNLASPLPDGAVTELWIKPTATSAYFYAVHHPGYSLVGSSGLHWQYYTGSAYANLPSDTLFTMGTWYSLSVRQDIPGDRYKVLVNGADKGWITNNAQFNAASQISQVSLLNAQSSGTGTVFIDLVRVRKYAASEPTASAGGETPAGF